MPAVIIPNIPGSNSGRVLDARDGNNNNEFENVAGVDGGSTFTGSSYNSTDNDLYSSLANMFYNTNAMDYERALDLLKRQNEFSATQAQINRDFQERMSNTAYQRQADDLRLAGFNPALVLGAGGATTPSGSSASSGNVDLPNLLSSLSSAFTSIYTNAITTATTQRGQDITAETTKRGQDMKLIGDVLKIVGDIASDFIPTKRVTDVYRHNVE